MHTRIKLSAIINMFKQCKIDATMCWKPYKLHVSYCSEPSKVEMVSRTQESIWEALLKHVFDIKHSIANQLVSYAKSTLSR